LRYSIYFAPEAIDDLNKLRALERAKVRDWIKDILGSEPTRTSKSRIKRLRGLSKPQYRLRVDNIRVYYDVKGEEVEVLAMIPKDRSEEWLARVGVKDEGSTTDRSEG
jgi:mRNA-degrading endonuclease RelE of RelBE toxin-antitoxin system